MRTSDINIEFDLPEESPRQVNHRPDKVENVIALFRYVVTISQLDTSSIDWDMVEKELRQIL